MTEDTLIKALKLGENDDWEFKKGRGGIDKSFMQTVSAFGNTQGGVVVCGVLSQNNDKTHVPIGIEDPEAYRKTLWDALHNPQLITHCPCRSGDDVWVAPVNGVVLVCARIPAADRKNRPVYIPENPLTGTYKRRGSGDYRCTEDEVRQMMRDAVRDPQDGLMFGGTSLKHLHKATLAAYRNVLAAEHPGHPDLRLGDERLLRKLGALRDGSEKGLTLAGALMFGTRELIGEVAPTVFLDYSEKTSSDPGRRYDDRITSYDAGWAPNLFNFYYESYPRLVRGLKTPFALGEDAMRKGETPFHKALREATVNTIIHAAYQAGGAITIEKRRDAYIFQNPGRSLTPIDRIIYARDVAEGLSDVRNPLLLGMFYMIGLAERRGSGYPAIFRAWDEGKRHSPTIHEDPERNLTRVTLPLLSQFSAESENELRDVVGPQFALLSGLDKDILMHAHQFGETSNQALQFTQRADSHQIGDRLRFLVDQGWLERHGSGGRGRTYRIALKRTPNLLDGGSPAATGEGRADNRDASPPKDRPPYPKEDLNALIAHVRNKKRATREEVEAVILEVCRGEFRTSRELADMLGRQPNKVRDNYLSPMVKDGRLARLHKEPGHPEQAYITAGT